MKYNNIILYISSVLLFFWMRGGFSGQTSSGQGRSIRLFQNTGGFGNVHESILQQCLLPNRTKLRSGL